MRKIILSVTTIIVIAAGISIGSMIQAASRTPTRSATATLSPQEFMARLGKDLPVEKWEHPF
ncbi:MAG TPA: hypothetical protein VE865_11150 [Bradyrhizobium sp.]|nr:hypothetical protein [Bradyrhizobium sp.]